MIEPCPVCRSGVRKASAHLELNLVRDTMGNKTNFYRYIRSRSQMRESETHY